MKNYTITVNGTAYNVTVEENNGSAPAVAAQAAPAPQAPAAKPASAPAAQVSGGKSVDAPMPGNILDVKVKVGDKVTAGTTLVILEAMKMENEIVAPNDGTVASINVNKGDTVDSGQSLVTLN